MIKKSTVKSVQANGTWEGKFGMMYKFEVEFENEDFGEYSSKTQDQTKFVIGQEMEYEYIDGHFPKVKPVYQKPDFASNGFSGGYKKDDNVQKMIVKQSSLKSAVDYCSGGNCSTSDVLKVAQEFVDWVMEKKDEPKQTSVKTHFENMEKDINDLPF